MKVGNIVNGLEVIDVKRVNKMNIIQFTKAVSEYIDQGYKIDVNSSRAIGLVLQVDMYKLESSAVVGSVGVQLDTKADEVRQEGVEKSVEEAKDALDNFTTPEQNDATVKKPTQRSKKTT